MISQLTSASTGIHSVCIKVAIASPAATTSGAVGCSDAMAGAGRADAVMADGLPEKVEEPVKSIRRSGVWAGMATPLAVLLRLVAGDLLRFDRRDFGEPTGEVGIVGPGSVSWRVFGNPLSLAVGGIAAVIMELGEPRVRAGVWQHSSFRTDPRERIRRTGAGALITVFAARSRVAAYARQVNAIHAGISGTAPEGTAYRADDPELLHWVQATAAFGFAEAYGRLVRPLSPGEADLFYAEAAVGAAFYGAEQAARTQGGMGRYLAGMARALTPSPVIAEFLAIMRSGPILPKPLKWLQPVLVAAAIECVPMSFRERIGLAAEPSLRPAERMLLKALARAAEWVRLPDDPRRLACKRISSPPAASGPPRS